jgi:hypothetical protein
MLYFMNIRLKNMLLFVGFSVATYLSAKLWIVFPYPNVMNVISIILSGVLLVVAIQFFAKIFIPKAKFIELVCIFFLGP